MNTTRKGQRFAAIRVPGAIQTYTGRYGQHDREPLHTPKKRAKLEENGVALSPDSMRSSSEGGIRNTTAHAAMPAEALKATLKQPFLSHALELLPHLVHHAVFPSKAAQSVALSEVDGLPGSLRSGLEELGFSSIYLHQLETRNKLREGKDVIITTPTSSGKSLCFNLGVFEHLLGHRDSASALYLFPLNALAQDQHTKLLQLNECLPLSQRLTIVCLTGSSEVADRMRMFRDGPPHIVITNPDILHHQLHRGRDGSKGWEHWREFLCRLRFCILDEAHTYSGVLGCHTANLMRRLYTQVEVLGRSSIDSIQFIIASATVGNAVQMASKLISRTGEERRDRFHWVQESAARTPERVLLSLAAQEHPYSMAAKIIRLWIDAGWRSLVFCNSIARATSLLAFVQENKHFASYSPKIRSYYSSLPAERKVKLPLSYPIFVLGFRLSTGKNTRSS